MTFTIS